MPANGPWRPLLVRVFRGSDGRKAIWFASNDTDQFPTFVEKLDPAGRTRGVFWHPGIVEQVRPWRYQGRAVMLIAGANNDFHGASLAVVDEADPTGTGPAPEFQFPDVFQLPPAALVQ